MARLILASESPRRSALLHQMGLEFEVIPSNSEEEVPSGLAPEQVAERLALRKARTVAATKRDALVIGADTIVVLGDTILNKPSGPDEARQMLRQLSGKEHRVITGMALVDTAGGREAHDTVTTAVRFAELNDLVIDRYVASGEPLDKAGAYGIQGYAALLIEGIRGCYFNVVGLPIRRLAEMLSDFGYDAFQMGPDGYPPEPTPKSVDESATHQ